MHVHEKYSTIIFSPEDAFQRMRYDPRVITVTLDLYMKGCSLRKISDHLDQFYGIKVNHTTILRWIRKFGKLIEEYVDSLEPTLSEQWHTDEQMIKVKGKWMWLWNTIDRDTRYMLTSMITEKRKVKDARRVFQKAKAVGKSKPKTVVTDGLQAYHRAFNKEFFTLRARGVSSVYCWSRIPSDNPVVYCVPRLVA